MIDETTNQSGNEPERVGFCQDCGRPLTRETARPVGSSVFCEPCLQARVGAGAAGTVPPPPPYGANAGTPDAAMGSNPYREPFPPLGGSNPSPGLAALLGLIPGVGAMYNGQFAKGIAHIVIFAILQSLANMNGFFGVFVAGWVLYQVFEAYHTAKARRDGMPLPDPFGLNDIGSHVGIHFRGKGAPGPVHSAGYTGWTSGQTVVTPPPAASAAAGTPVSPYEQAAPPVQAAPVWDTPAWAPPPPPAAAAPGQHWADTPSTFSPEPVMVPVQPSRFPAAAMWLIGFGVLFLLLNLVPDLQLHIHEVFPFLLIAFGIGLFIKRMAQTGGVGPGADEGDGYGYRAAMSLRAPVMLVTVGVLWMLQEFGVIYFHRSWPVIVIVVGLLMLVERSVGSRALPVAPYAGTDANGDRKGN